MNRTLIGELVRLRYKLMWAKTRSRNGKIALFIIGYLIFLLVAAILALGGFGAGVVAIRSGYAEQVAQIVLSGLFVNSIIITVIAGFGMNAVFSDVELRRYPLFTRERFAARHILGIADPFWFFILFLELGLVMGLYAYGTFSFWNGLVAALLLFLCAYLFTRVLGVWLDQLLATRSGHAVAIVLIIGVSLVPGIVMSTLRNSSGSLPKILAPLRFTPPFGAAAVMTHGGWDLLFGLAILIAWLVALFVLLIMLEQRPPAHQQATVSAGSEWSSRFDRIGAIFGPRMGPLVGHWLRFYWRNNRFRALYFLSIPLAAFLAFSISQPRRHGGSLFIGVLGAFAIVSFFGGARIAVNQFGYAGGAFRRFFLLPTDPGASLRAGSYAALLLGAACIPPAAILWIIFAPRPLDPRILFMPVMNAITALFLFHGLALWTSIYAAKRGNYDKTFGNDLSLGGNIVFIGTMLGCMFLPSLLQAEAPWAVSPDNWWLTLPPAAIAIAFYLASLRGASAQFSARREALLAVVEGKA